MKEIEVYFSMADNTKFVLRWEIDNAAARFATKNLKSGVFNGGGFEWILGVRNNDALADDPEFTITCRNQRCQDWKCEADIEFVLHNPDGNYSDEVYSISKIINLTKLCSRNEKSKVTLLIGDKRLDVSKD
ncbi:hypothetical protein PENTCL1PPCAC_24729, partial [Pristionchus entomophagus]